MLVREKFSCCYFGGSYLDKEREFKHGTKCQTSTINSIFYSFSLILKNAFFVLKKLFESRQNSARMAEFCQAGKNPLPSFLHQGLSTFFLALSGFRFHWIFENGGGFVNKNDVRSNATYLGIEHGACVSIGIGVRFSCV